TLLRAENLLGNLPDRDPFGLFRRNRAIHELERLPLKLPFFWEHAHSGMTDDDRQAMADVGHCDAACLVSGRLDDDSAVHLLVCDGPPPPVEADFRALIGRAVESFRERPLDVGLLN